MKIFLNHEFISLNDYINAERMNKFKAAKIKENETNIAAILLKKHCNDIKSLKLPLELNFVWYLKDRRKDIDNVAFAKKFINDGLVKSGCLKNDGQKQIIALSDKIKISKTFGVEIEFKETRWVI